MGHVKAIRPCDRDGRTSGVSLEKGTLRAQVAFTLGTVPPRLVCVVAMRKLPTKGLVSFPVPFCRPFADGNRTASKVQFDLERRSLSVAYE